MFFIFKKLKKMRLQKIFGAVINYFINTKHNNVVFIKYNLQESLIN